MAMPPSRVEVRRDGDVAVLALNRPDKRNALDRALLDEMLHALAALEAAPDVRAVVLTGHGSAFSAGADRSPVAGLAGDALARAFAPLAEAIAGGIAQVMLRLVTTPKPVVAAVNGHAVGGALILALGCDVRVAADTALFWMPEIGMGRAIGDPSLATLVACTGPLVAKEIVLRAQRFTAAEMAARGLVNRVVAPADVTAAALDWARTLAAYDAAAMASVKARANASLAAIWQRACAVHARA